MEYMIDDWLINVQWQIFRASSDENAKRKKDSKKRKEKIWELHLGGITGATAFDCHWNKWKMGRVLQL